MKRFGWLGILFVAAAWDAGARETERNAIWRAEAEPTLPQAAIDGFPSNSAGCLVLGHYILADGQVERVRVMQGAFTPGTTPEARQAFTDAALTSVDDMQFRKRSRSITPMAIFDWQVVGYAASGTDGAPAWVFGEKRQDARVREECQLEGLADWARKQPRPPHSANDLAGGQMLAPFREPMAAYWISDPVTLTIPRYPMTAARSGVEGCVLVGLTVDGSGKPGGFRILKTQLSRGAGVPIVKSESSSRSSNDYESAFEQAALTALANWRFMPGPDNLAGMPAFLQIPVDFALEGLPVGVECAAIDFSKPTPRQGAS